MQVPAPVGYERASNLDDALAILRKHGADARVIAGGHSLLPMMKLRLVQPEVLVDINDLEELSFIKVEQDEMRLGSMVRHAELLSSPLVKEHFPIISEAEKVIADPIVRNRGTLGGSLCQADPSEDLSAVFAALKATMVLRGPRGARSVSADEFHTGPYSTVVEDDELLVEVKIPIRPGCGCAYEKVERRVGDWAIAAVGTAIYISDGKIVDAGIGLTAVGAPGFEAPEAAEVLIGSTPDAAVFQRAAVVAAQNCNPSADQRGPIDYKRHLVKVLTERALNRSYDNVKMGGIR